MRKSNYPVEGFVEKIHEAWYNSGLTQEQIADLVGTGRQSINNYLSGWSVPNATVLARMCSALNVSADYLLGLKEGE